MVVLKDEFAHSLSEKCPFLYYLNSEVAVGSCFIAAQTQSQGKKTTDPTISTTGTTCSKIAFGFSLALCGLIMEISSINVEGEAEFVKCDSCGFTEECTSGYISRIRERYCGMWICGLCIEAVKDEVLRSGRLISTQEALNRHVNVCKNFRSSSPPPCSKHPIFAMGEIMRKSLDSPRSGRSSPTSSTLRPIGRSAGRCFSALS